jgi:hypothetical protein
LEEESTKLRKLLRKESERNKTNSSKMTQFQLQNEELLKETAGLRKLIGSIGGTDNVATRFAETQEQMERLKAEIHEKEAMIQELNSNDKSGSSNLAGENRRLRREVEIWQLRHQKLAEGEKCIPQAQDKLSTEYNQLKGYCI